MFPLRRNSGETQHRKPVALKFPSILKFADAMFLMRSKSHAPVNAGVSAFCTLFAIAAKVPAACSDEWCVTIKSDWRSAAKKSRREYGASPLKGRTRGKDVAQNQCPFAGATHGLELWS